MQVLHVFSVDAYTNINEELRIKSRVLLECIHQQNLRSKASTALWLVLN